MAPSTKCYETKGVGMTIDKIGRNVQLGYRPVLESTLIVITIQYKNQLLHILRNDVFIVKL